MSSCWPEGELRAYLDRELPPGDLERVAAHLAECPACRTQCEELAGRASRIVALMQTLRAESAPRPAIPVKAQTRKYWRAAGAAAAAVLVASAGLWLMVGKSRPAQPLTTAPRHAASVLPAAQPDVVSAPPVAPAAEPAKAPAAARPAPKRRVVPRPSRPKMEYFYALDDDPIDAGVVVRVTLDDHRQADVILSSDGRARAIRLVNGN
ncbi:MAG TPA: anti-sigma factor [Bryobacteraceae bacterium]|nr:anti-sigma factor [Bryobacteraceae bacterium]